MASRTAKSRVVPEGTAVACRDDRGIRARRARGQAARVLLTLDAEGGLEHGKLVAQHLPLDARVCDCNGMCVLAPRAAAWCIEVHTLDSSGNTGLVAATPTNGLHLGPAALRRQVSDSEPHTWLMLPFSKTLRNPQAEGNKREAAPQQALPCPPALR